MANGNASVWVSRRYTFEAAHFLPKVRDGHKCKRNHGHNYEIVMSLFGDVREDGFVIDFWDLDEMMAPAIELVDHRTLNDIDGLDNPTAENIAFWFAERFVVAWKDRDDDQPKNVRLVRVECFETKDCSATVNRIVE